MTIEELKKTGWIAYEYIRGSHAYGLNTPDSDVDMGGVFICPMEMLLGLRSNYIEQVADEKNDTVYYEFGRWIELLLKANPTALESLFVPKRCIIGDVHPAIQKIIDHRDIFLSKECFKTLTGYAISQIGKARGLNKKIVNPVTERKEVLDFCYTFKNQGSQAIKDFLVERNLNQKYCGLVNIPNMKDTYGVYYDFAAYFKFENLSDEEQLECCRKNGIDTAGYSSIQNRIQSKDWFGYAGIVNPDGESNEVRLSSIPKGEIPICFMTYNQNGYESHCKKYKEYMDWVAHRNPKRYESNLGQNYDGKNMCHCMRLTRMGKELALGLGFNVERTEDRDYLLAIKNHEFEYDEIMAQAEKEKAEMEEAMKNCTLPDKVDLDRINSLLIEARIDRYLKNNA